MIDWTPQPIAFSVGPLAVHWYGIMYAIGLAATFIVVEREARRRGLDTGLLANGFIVIAFAALVGGRLYHVIDQWDARYRNDLLAIVLPPYSGLGVYGGIATGFLAAVLYTRWKRPAVPGLGRRGRAGPARDAGRGTLGQLLQPGALRAADQPAVGDRDPVRESDRGVGLPAGGTTPVDAHFVPLFLYESISGLVGAVVLLLLARRARSLRPGDVVLLFFAWYGTTRFLLEPLRTNNWTARRDPNRLDHLGRCGGRRAPPARVAASSGGISR